MRWTGVPIFLTLFLSCGGFGDALEPYRMLPALDLQVFGCSPDPGHHLLSSESELMENLQDLSPHCRPAEFRALKARFLSGLSAAKIRWEDESLVIVQEWYGTGKAKGRLELSEARSGVVQARIVWKAPPPPVTPDTTVFRSAFAARKGAIARIEISGKVPETIELPVPR